MKSIYYNGELENAYIDAILKEIYRERVYDRFLLGKENAECLDIGANVGLVSQYLARFSSKVYAVEPSADHFAALSKMVKENKLENVVPYNAALMDKDGDVTFYHNPNATMYSTVAAVNDGSEAETVKGVDAHTLFKDLKIDKIDFMKLDVEGSEFDVLVSTGFERVADRIGSIMIEYHTWTNRNPGQLFDIVKGYGFKTFQIAAEATLIGGIR